MRRSALRILALTAVIVIAVCSIAFAAKPSDGTWKGKSVNAAVGTNVKHKKVIVFAFLPKKCDTKGSFAGFGGKSFPLSKRWTFKFTAPTVAMVPDPAGGVTKITGKATVSGSFPKAKKGKASVTYTQGSCSEKLSVTFNWVAKGEA